MRSAFAFLIGINDDGLAFADIAFRMILAARSLRSLLSNIFSADVRRKEPGPNHGP